MVSSQGQVSVKGTYRGLKITFHFLSSKKITLIIYFVNLDKVVGISELTGRILYCE